MVGETGAVGESSVTPASEMDLEVSKLEFVASLSGDTGDTFLPRELPARPVAERFLPRDKLDRFSVLGISLRL